MCNRAAEVLHTLIYTVPWLTLDQRIYSILYVYKIQNWQRPPSSFINSIFFLRKPEAVKAKRHQSPCRQYWEILFWFSVYFTSILCTYVHCTLYSRVGGRRAINSKVLFSKNSWKQNIKDKKGIFTNYYTGNLAS